MSSESFYASAPSPGIRLPAGSNFDDPTTDGLLSHSPDGKRLDTEADRALIVDDDPLILQVVSKMAAHLGYRPTAVDDPLDALFFLGQAHYDVVLSDYQMPVMNGFQLADQIKKKHFGTRVIIMSGHGEHLAAEMEQWKGAVDGWLVKPFKLATMEETIKMVTNRYC